MTRLILTGGSGLLALNWAVTRAPTDSVFLWTNTRTPRLDACSVERVDLADQKQIGDLIDQIKPDLLVNAAAYTDVDGCEIDPYRSHASNFEVAVNLSIETKKRGVKFVHVSTDQLFNETISCSCENTPVSPLNKYGKDKAEAERFVLNNHRDALVVRTSFFGWGPPYRRSFSDKIIDALSDGQCVSLFDDVFFTPLEVTSLVDITHQLVHAQKFGIFNVCSTDKISKYQFGVLLAEKFGLDVDLIQPIQAKRIKSKAKRSLNLSMSNKKLCETIEVGDVSVASSIEKLKKNTEFKDRIYRVGKIIPYGRHFVDNADVEAVSNVLLNEPLTQGPAVERFEDKIAAFVGAKYAVAVSSATAGLHVAYKALGLMQGLTALVSPITFVSTANAAHFCGGSARFADIDSGTLNMDPSRVEEAISANSDIHLVAPTLFSGSGEGIKEVSEIAKKNNLPIVEDAAHGLGGSYPCGAKIGSCKYSDCTVFSLHPVKTIAAGEGGVITTNDFEVYRALLRLRSHGINKLDEKFNSLSDAFTDGEQNLWYYEMNELGYHYRFTDIQAALALSQMSKLDRFISKRRVLSKKYTEWIENTPNISRAHNVNVSLSANHLMPVLIDFRKAGITRNDLMKSLSARGIITQVHYIPVVNQPFYARQGHLRSDFPNSQSYFSQCLSLPLFFGLSESDFSFVTEQIEGAIAC